GCENGHPTSAQLALLQDPARGGCRRRVHDDHLHVRTQRREPLRLSDESPRPHACRKDTSFRTSLPFGPAFPGSTDGPLLTLSKPCGATTFPTDRGETSALSTLPSVRTIGSCRKEPRVQSSQDRTARIHVLVV